VNRWQEGLDACCRRKRFTGEYFNSRQHGKCELKGFGELRDGRVQGQIQAEPKAQKVEPDSPRSKSGRDLEGPSQGLDDTLGRPRGTIEVVFLDLEPFERVGVDTVTAGW
jgi:hypothetical protein